MARAPNGWGFAGDNVACVILGYSSMEAMRLAHGALAFDYAAQVNLKITAATPTSVSTPIERPSGLEGK